VTHELHRCGIVANHKRIARIMGEAGLGAKPRKRFVVTTDSNHTSPVYPNLAKGFVPSGPDQLWVADITYLQVGSRPTKSIDWISANGDGVHVAVFDAHRNRARRTSIPAKHAIEF
jgi:transposase InsO family protein